MFCWLRQMWCSMVYRDFGFDPLGLGTVPENLERFKESELYHCRWAMLAVVSSFFLINITVYTWSSCEFFFKAEENKCISARNFGAWGIRFGQLGTSSAMGCNPWRTSKLLGQSSSMGHPSHHSGNWISCHCVCWAPKKHRERPWKEEVPWWCFRPSRLLQGPQEVRGNEAQGSQKW